MKKKDMIDVLEKIKLYKDKWVCDGCLENIKFLLEKEFRKEKK